MTPHEKVEQADVAKNQAQASCRYSLQIYGAYVTRRAMRLLISSLCDGLI
jgi:hypothetical protein